MEAVKEITVFLENHPGALARVTSSLGEQGISILAFTLSNQLDHGALRMVLGNPTGALHLFAEHNLLALEGDVIMLRLRHEADALARLADGLGEAGVNIEYAYGSAGEADDGLPALILRVSDLERGMEVLAGVEGVE